jgi:hypothetical protein
MKAQEIQARMILNGTYQLLVRVDDINLLGDNIDTIRNRETSIEANKKFGLKVNKEKTTCTCILLSHHQNTGENHDLYIYIYIYK